MKRRSTIDKSITSIRLIGQICVFNSQSHLIQYKLSVSHNIWPESPEHVLSLWADSDKMDILKIVINEISCFICHRIDFSKRIGFDVYGEVLTTHGI